MPETTCRLYDCDNPRQGRSTLCGPHNARLYKYGDPYFTPPPRKYADVTGQRFGNLIALEHINGGWLCQCDCGGTISTTITGLRKGLALTCGNVTVHRRTHQPRYITMHNRLRTDRGPASNYTCVDCRGTAHHWSYDNADPNELIEASPRHRDVRYSGDVNHYQPRCRSCHRRFDMADRVRRGEPALVRQAKVGRGRKIADQSIVS